MNHSLAVVILAAGKGTRMKSTLPKVLHPLAQRPMLLHVLDAVAPLKPAHTLVITGHGAEAVEQTVAAAYPDVSCLRQTEQLGTAHAVLQTKDVLAGFDGTVVILNGDVPLITTDALQQFIENHDRHQRAVTIASAHVADPTGLGRILRDSAGAFLTNREHKDCSPEEQAITESNVGFYVISGRYLFDLLNQVGNNNVQQEYYLPDVAELALQQGLTVDATVFAQPSAELGGINNRVQLAQAESLLQQRYRTQHMLNGATLQDPATTYFAWDTQLGQDVTIGQGVVFGPGVTVADNVEILPFSHIAGATIEPGCAVGPFARLRSGSHLKENVELGCFVVTKKATIGTNSKAKQLNCLVDCTIGNGVNVGAGAIIANYHHFKKEKYPTVVGDGASLGANAVLVSPVTVEANGFVAASTTVRKTVPANALVVDKPEQVVKENYKK